jgi:GNAT superfamily N-acetyltransferase
VKEYRSMTTKQRNITIVANPQDYPCLPTHPALAKFDPATLVAHGSDEHLILAEQDIQLARCSLWWTNTPCSPQGRNGLIGHYAATDATAARELLDIAANRLTLHGCSFALAPIDQHTWRDYRLAVSGTDRPKFLFEPYHGNPSSEPLAQAGFRPIAWYFSALVENLTTSSPRVSRAWMRLQGGGITIRPLRREILEQELRNLHRIADAAFGDNPWYVPISENEFVAMYASMHDQIPLEFILVVEDRGCPVGFCFAVPDMLQHARGNSIDTLVIKTLGVVRDRRYAGLGQVLLQEVQQRAAAAGMNHAIHALVRETASLQNISRRYGKPFRRYALYGRELTL